MAKGTEEETTNIVELEHIGSAMRKKISKIFGRSLAIREVDAGSCNACEVEVYATTYPFYDLERFGLHVVASPRHADMLIVTGPVTRNMEHALLQTYKTTPTPSSWSPWARVRSRGESLKKVLQSKTGWIKLFR